MAKKSQRQQNPPKEKLFHSARFAALKGLAVSEEAPSEPIPPTVKKPVEAADDALELFLSAVADVRPLRSSGKKPVHASTPAPEKIAVQKREEGLRVEDRTFLEEISRLKLGTKFTDAVPDEDELQPLAGNRIRQVKRGIVSASHQLDLHGLTREEALDALPRFLRSAQKTGQKAVLVITGKGNHSSEAPVLHQAVASWLRDAGRVTVLEFAPAPREMGGSGAYVVFLRKLAAPD